MPLQERNCFYKLIRLVTCFFYTAFGSRILLLACCSWLFGRQYVLFFFHVTGNTNVLFTFMLLGFHVGYLLLLLFFVWYVTVWLGKVSW